MKGLGSVIKDLGSVIVVLGILGTLGILAVEELSKLPIFFKIPFIIFSVIAGIFLFRIFVLRFKKWRENTETREVKKELARIESQFDLRNFSSALPSDKILGRWLKLARLKGSLWSADARIEGVTLHIRKGDPSSKLEVSLQISYVSSWKNEMFIVWYGHVLEGAEHFKKLPKGYARSMGKPFFEYPGWRKAVLKAVEKINTNELRSFNIQLTSFDKDFNININYELGKIEHELEFSYNGKKLVDLMEQNPTI